MIQLFVCVASVNVTCDCVAYSCVKVLDDDVQTIIFSSISMSNLSKLVHEDSASWHTNVCQ